MDLGVLLAVKVMCLLLAGFWTCSFKNPIRRGNQFLFLPSHIVSFSHPLCHTHPLTPNHQGVCPEINGAFTGAVSTSMLDSVGVKWALAGHSERRVIFGETDEYINGQCKKLIDQGMAVMLCIGESEAEYEQNLAGAVCAVQLKKGLAGIAKEDLDRVAIACKSIRCWSHGASFRISMNGHPRIGYLACHCWNKMNCQGEILPWKMTRGPHAPCHLLICFLPFLSTLL